jgi:SAM-dependent methyltransferase
MTHNFNEYGKIENHELNQLIDLIMYNHNIDNIFSDDWLFNFFDKSDRKLKILDFGCGVGRNVFGLLEKSSNIDIVAYDSDKMLNRASEYCYSKYNKSISDYPNANFTSDWNYVKSQKFDYIYATLVLQHILEEELNQYCQDFKNITEKLIVHGRRHNDDTLNGVYKNTWKILENNGLFPISCTLQGNVVYKYSVYGDDLNEHFTCLYKL